MFMGTANYFLAHKILGKSAAVTHTQGHPIFLASYRQKQLRLLSKICQKMPHFDDASRVAKNTNQSLDLPHFFVVS
jgi:hypothetical protein